MKTVRKKVVADLEKVETYGGMCNLDVPQVEATFRVDRVINDKDRPELTIEVEVPETLKEFRDMHRLTKAELVDWLNDNYKQR